MTRNLTTALLTVGNPEQLTGGYLYQLRMAQLAPRHDIRIEFISFPQLPFPLAMAAAPEMLRRVRLTRPQAIVVDSLAATLMGPWLALRQPSLPLVGMLHQPPGGMESGPLRTWLQTRLDNASYRRAKRLIVSSELLRAQLVAEGVSPDIVRVVPPGRDITAPGEPPGDLRRGRQAAFLCVANWIERKGIHSLLDAFALLPMDTGTLHLVGNYEVYPRYTARLRARIDKPDLTGRVVVHGTLPPEDVMAMYRAADVFVMPSVGEPYGMVYGEAMTFGLPVVGWRSGNLPYLVEDGSEGLLATPGDVEGLARRLGRLASDEALRCRLGEAARLRAAALPTWEDSSALFCEAIREAVDAGYPQ